MRTRPVSSENRITGSPAIRCDSTTTMSFWTRDGARPCHRGSKGRFVLSRRGYQPDMVLSDMAESPRPLEEACRIAWASPSDGLTGSELREPLLIAESSEPDSA